MEKTGQPEVPKGYKTFQEFLDNHQYTRKGILSYEKIFGKNFVSTGGKDTTEEFVKLLQLKAGQHVLDIGCGIGGGAFFMAENYGVTVHGVDLSSNMIDIALERAAEAKQDGVKFEIADATKADFKPETFDVVYSRDTILHIENKKHLFQRCLTWLKPGGKLLISDYCCTDAKWSDDYSKYVAQRSYHVIPVSQYGKILEEAGFSNVKAEDKTDTFINSLNRELKRVKSIKEEFLKEFSQSEYDAIVNGWEDKLQRCGKGDQKWGLFYAEKSR